MVIYVDGVEVAARAAHGTIGDVNTPLSLGATKAYGNNGYVFNGQLDEVEIFDRALTATEIQSIYNAGSAGKCKTATPSACVAPPSGMVAWYPGDNNSEDLVGDNDGTLPDTTPFTGGKVAQALSFDGVDDYVLVPDHPSLDLPTAVSVDVWMRATSGSGFQGLVSKFEHYTHPAHDDAYNLSIENGTIRWQIVANGRDFQLNTPVLPIFDGEYHLLAGTYDSTAQRMVIYVDGVEMAAQAAYGTISDVNTPLYLGAAKTYGANNHYFNGQLDEVEIFDRALTAAQILSIYNAGSAGKCKTAAPLACVAPPAGMVAWYPGDNNSEDIAGDNDGTLQDNTTFTGGKVAQALSFDGVDDYVLVPDHPSLDLPTAVSVDVWMRATSGSGFQGLVSKFEHYTHPANDDAYNLSIENGTIRWQIVANGVDFQLNTAVLPIFDGEFHLLAGTYYSVAQRMVIYVDGVEMAAQVAYGTISDVSTPLYLGAAKTYGSNNHYFNGQLDEVEIFNRALTA
ncbi:MAG TPA: LamG-like jellyroll fold domain-containing protein, partial [Chloroflexia bacterium]|nr:LamG-like jellyroll fold domain-containing protein [Chloroflexia bacterium]